MVVSSRWFLHPILICSFYIIFIYLFSNDYIFNLHIHRLRKCCNNWTVMILWEYKICCIESCIRRVWRRYILFFKIRFFFYFEWRRIVMIWVELKSWMQFLFLFFYRSDIFLSFKFVVNKIIKVTIFCSYRTSIIWLFLM